MPRSSVLHTVPDSILDFEASIYRESFRHFIPAFWETISGAGHLVSNWHIDFMARKLEECAKRVKEGLPRVSDYVFNVPFGSSKSSVISILFPAWVWTFFPQARFISGTHTKELALDLSVKCKGVILSEKYQQLYPHVKLVKDTEGYFINEQGGDRLTCTVGGVTPTGFHGHFVIIDDPIDPQGARSELELDTAKKFMTEIIPGRKVDKDASVTILVMQRLEYRDPTAVMMKVAEDPNVVPVDLTCLPGELSEDLSPPLEEIRKLYPEAYIFDNLLDSKRLSRRTLSGYRVTLGNAYWSQIMQKPTPPGGGMFKVQFFSNRVKASPYEARRIRYWDRAQCLVAGTMVKTIEGQVSIENVRAGKWVLTREGYRRVEWAGVSGFVHDLNSVLFSNGSVVTGTLDHPVWTENRGWVELQHLSGEDIVCQNEKDQSETRLPKSSSFWEYLTVESQGEDTTRRCDGTRSKRDIGAILFIVPSGDSTLGKFLKDGTFTTRTTIGTTTPLRIWNVSVVSIIIDGMMHSKNGMEQRLRESITSVLEDCGRRRRSTKSTSVEIVGKIVSRDIKTLPDFNGVPSFVERDSRIENSERFVVSVERLLKEDLRRDVVRPVARKWEYSPESAPVYDLQVEGQHEFFANGILVHNTQDAGCYTAGVLMAKDKDGFYYVEHVVHGQWEPFQRNAIIAATALRDRVRYGPKWEPTIWIEEETGSTGKESFQRMAQQLSGYVVRSDKPTGSKDTRADPWSSACAAALIRVVDNGESRNLGRSDWDVEGFVLEHCLFKPEPGKRMGGFKDQVDAAGGAYNLLSGLKTGEGMRVFTIGESRHKGLRIVVCSRDNLAQTVTQHSALLISIQDPFVEEEVMHNDSEGSHSNGSTNGMAKTLCDNGAGGQLTPNPPAHGLSRCLGSLVLQFADVAPKEYQDKWDEPLQPWNKKPEELQMSRDDGKKLWAFLLKKRDPNPDVIVIQDDGDRRALSLSYSICDVLHLPRSIIHVVGNEEMTHKDKESPNEHVYNVSKLGRSMVVG